MITVKIGLYDTVEINAFAQFSAAIERYRMQLANPAPAPVAQDAPVSENDPAIVGAIPSSLPSIKDEQLNAVAQAFMARHGKDGYEKALAILKEFGVNRIGELKDPAMRLALYERFTK